MSVLMITLVLFLGHFMALALLRYFYLSFMCVYISCHTCVQKLLGYQLKLLFFPPFKKKKYLKMFHNM